MTMIAFEEVGEEVEGKRLLFRFDAGDDQTYALIDYYCTDQACPCDEASIRLFQMVEDPPVIAFRAPFQSSHPIFDEATKPSELDQAIAEELMLDQAVLEVLKQRRQAVRADALVEVARPKRKFEGFLYGFRDFMGAVEGKPMRFWQGSLTLDAIDRACVRPSCDCTEMVLSFSEVGPEDSPRSHPPESTLDVRIDVASGALSRVEADGPFTAREQAIIKDFKDSLGEDWQGMLQLRRDLLRALARSQLIFREGTARAAAGPARNDPCHCGSGKKFKKCHGAPA